MENDGVNNEVEGLLKKILSLLVDKKEYSDTFLTRVFNMYNDATRELHDSKLELERQRYSHEKRLKELDEEKIIDREPSVIDARAKSRASDFNFLYKKNEENAKIFDLDYELKKCKNDNDIEREKEKKDLELAQLDNEKKQIERTQEVNKSRFEIEKLKMKSEKDFCELPLDDKLCHLNTMKNNIPKPKTISLNISISVSIAIEAVIILFLKSVSATYCDVNYHGFGINSTLVYIKFDVVILLFLIAMFVGIGIFSSIIIRGLFKQYMTAKSNYQEKINNLDNEILRLVPTRMK